MANESVTRESAQVLLFPTRQSRGELELEAVALIGKLQTTEEAQELGHLLGYGSTHDLQRWIIRHR